ncbi:MAG: S41 family peptidase [Pseudomonadota bacterium]|nr:S41 family peptidase [Pseudomonadota bacterium]
MQVLRLREILIMIMALASGMTHASLLNTQKLDHAFEYINKLYVTTPPADFTEPALTGILQGLDKHSQYLTKRDADFLKMLTHGGFVGIGVSLQKIHNDYIIASILPQSPASDSDLNVGDIITHIDDRPIQNSDIIEVSQLIRGPENTIVKLTTKHSDSPVFIKRSKIDFEELSFTRLPNNLGLIKINIFNEDTIKSLKSALTSLSNTQALIIDLRSNPGGLLFSALQATTFFLDYKTHKNANITRIIDREDTVHVPLPNQSVDLYPNKPLFLLVGPKTASGAEIFAAALKHHNRATLIGIPTNGKGTIQTLLPLDDGSMLKLTTAYFTTPDGAAINNIGVAPHHYTIADPFEAYHKAIDLINDLLTKQE